ncbi:MAG: protein translocase subunit SecF [Candidatus Eisenbacteria bacterium]
MSTNKTPGTGAQHKFFTLLPPTHIPFMKYRKYAYAISLAIVLATVAYLLVKGPRYSVDFTGGTLLQIQTARPLPADDVRAVLAELGHGGAELQAAGDGRELLIRMPLQTETAYRGIDSLLTLRHPDSRPELRRQETVGPRIGAELRSKAFWAVLFSMGAILLYIGLRYEFKFAFGAIVAVFHDVFAAFGVLMFLQREISLTVIAALLTLAGYSINDTIVVFDRIKERGKQLHKMSREDAMNQAINETLSRTLITSVSVFLATLALYIWGGDVINDFALCILAGVVFGTYSSIYVASALALDTWLWLDKRKSQARKTRAA